MKKRRLGQPGMWVLAMVVLWTAAPVRAEDTFEKAVRAASPSVVKIVMNVRTLFARSREIPCGSGVILDGDGYVVASAPAAAFGRALRLNVVLADGSKHAARRLATDVKSGLVILKIECTGLQAIPLRTDEDPRVGQWVVTIGDPFGLSRTRTDPLSASVGVISAYRRLRAAGFAYDGPVILTDITLNPGGEGGAMVDLEGRLVGICGRVVTSTRTNTQLSYAVPASEAARLLAEARRVEAMPAPTPQPPTPTPTPTPQPPGPTPPADERPGYLGAYILDDAEGTKGAFIDRVVPDSPAGKAGLAHGDVVVRINRTRIANGRQLIRELDRLTVGANVQLTLQREKVELDVTVTLGEVPTPVLK